jgi:hypothetical protein
MIKTPGAERFNERRAQKKHKEAILKTKRSYKDQEKALEVLRKKAGHYIRMTQGQAMRALCAALNESEPLRLLFVARFLGRGEHQEELADFLRIEFAKALYAGDPRMARRSQEALAALLQKDRPFFVCNCPPVDFSPKDQEPKRHGATEPPITPGLDSEGFCKNAALLVGNPSDN